MIEQPRLVRPAVIHRFDCNCGCGWPAATGPALSLRETARWCVAGIATGSAVAFAIDAHGALSALLAIVGAIR